MKSNLSSIVDLLLEITERKIVEERRRHKIFLLSLLIKLKKANGQLTAPNPDNIARNTDPILAL